MSRMPRFALTLVAVALVAVLVVPRLFRSVQVNRWSLRLAATVAEHRTPRVEELERLAAALPEGHWRGRVALARAAVRVGVPDRSLAWLEAARGVTHPWIPKARAEALAALGRWREAYREWAAAGDAQALARAAHEAFTTGREEDGLAARRAWFEVDPVGAAWPVAEAINRVEKDPRKAAEFLREVAMRYPAAPVAIRRNWWYQAGNFFRVAKAWDEAESAYAALAALAPEDWRAGVGRAWLVYQRDGAVEQALRWLAEAKRRAPDRGEPWANGGLILMGERRFREATEWFAEAVARNPQAAWWRLWWANAVRAAGDWERARRLHEEVAERFPRFPQGYYELAWTYSRLDLHKQALGAIGRALELQNPPNVQFFWRAGAIAEDAGRTELAVRYYQRVLELAPNHHGARDALRRLAASPR